MSRTITRIHVFRPGRHMTMKGQSLQFSEADVSRMAQVYDPAVHEAPLVVGHPSADAPAYGFVASLSAAGDGQLHATPHQVNADFAELVASGTYKHVSASFYTPGSPGHPLKGQAGEDAYYLRHVGFLGAQPPAIKGLQPVEFADGEEGVVEFSEAWNPAPGVLARFLRRLRETWVDEKGVEAADKLLPPYEIESLERAAAESDVRQQLAWEKERGLTPAFAEVAKAMDGAAQAAGKATDAVADLVGSAAFAEAAAALARREAELAEREAAIASQAAQQELAAAEAVAAQRVAEHAAFAERLASTAVAAILPRDVPVVAAILGAVEGGAPATVSFGEGEEVATGDAVRRFLEGLPRVVEYGELSADRSATQPPALDLADPRAIADAAVAFQESEAAAGRVVSTSVAVAHVMASAAG